MPKRSNQYLIGSVPSREAGSAGVGMLRQHTPTKMERGVGVEVLSRTPEATGAVPSVPSRFLDAAAAAAQQQFQPCRREPLAVAPGAPPPAVLRSGIVDPAEVDYPATSPMRRHMSTDPKAGEKAHGLATDPDVGPGGIPVRSRCHHCAGGENLRRVRCCGVHFCLMCLSEQVITATRRADQQLWCMSCQSQWDLHQLARACRVDLPGTSTAKLYH